MSDFIEKWTAAIKSLPKREPMTAEPDLLPLHYDELPEVPADIVARMQSYARANVTHATAAKDAEIESLRAEVYRLQELCNGLHRSLTDSQAGFVHHRDRAERLAEALRDAADDLDRGVSRGDVAAHMRARAAREQEAGRG